MHAKFSRYLCYIYIYMPVPHPRTQTSVPPPSTHTSDRRLISEVCLFRHEHSAAATGVTLKSREGVRARAQRLPRGVSEASPCTRRRLCATVSYVLHTSNSQTYIHACLETRGLYVGPSFPGIYVIYIYASTAPQYPDVSTATQYPYVTHTSNFLGVSVSSRTFSSGEGCHSEIAGGGTGEGAAPPPRGARSEPLRTSTPVQRMSGDLLLPRAPASNDATTPTQSQPLARRSHASCT